MKYAPFQRIFRFLFVLSILSISVHLNGQISNVEFKSKNFPAKEAEFKKADDALKKGDYYFLRGPVYFQQALENYLIAQDFNPDNADLNHQIGLCYLNLQVDRLKSLPYLERARMLNVDLGIDFLFSLGNAYQYNLEFNKAIRVYETYIDALKANSDDKKIAKAEKSIVECKSGIELLKKPVPVRIDNLGPGVNSKFPDYAPVFSEDESKLIFTSRRENTTGGMVDAEDSLFYEDIYITYKIDSDWAPAKNIGKPINEDDHDASINLSADGKKLLIYRTSNGGDIFESTLTGITWSIPIPLKEINTRGYENHATYSPDGKYLFFISIRKDSSGFGGKDIYIADLDGQGNAYNIRNAGNVINSAYDEDGVYFHPDGKTVYFSSKGFNSMGGYDVFKSTWENDRFSPPVNMGYPINSPEDDVFFIITKNGKSAYFSSYREEGYGDKDIYVMNFLEEAELLSSLKISIRDTSSQKPILANISIRDAASGELIIEKQTENGDASANLPVGKSYEIQVIANKYAPFSEIVELPLDAANQVVLRMVEMSRFAQTKVSGTVNDRSSKIPLISQLDFMDAATLEIVKSCTSDKNGDYKITLPSGRIYAVQVKTVDYAFLTDTLNVRVSESDQDIKKSFELNRLENSQVSVLKGRIYDAVTGEDLTAQIDLTEFGGQPVLLYYKPGKYDCIVHSGAILNMSVQLNGYLNYSEQINIPESKIRQEIVHDIALVRAEKGAKIVLNNIFFDFNKSTLRPTSYKALNTLLTMLKQYPAMVVEISGHTDNVGSMDYNQKLSENRTNVVRDYLVRNGINPKNIAAFGRSFRQPIASNDTEQGRQMNRRTEFKIVRMN